ncbi:hypothetical protein [Ulvibacter antarcticus]|uniref:DUF4412 domain-containing protein n=1 Tax=Ulvibacter antarcticus TaxID=442714 RepID=A0A3L9YI99_9FLAO|nr:hypothetical protein [Ulvibacter antarcticus]RMA57648.1 hypothetical protein BXY75_2451 [Ulvibacter antarcticus]
MTRVISFLILLVLISAFQAPERKDFFEGKVTYQLEYDPIHKNATVEFLEENYGVTEIMYYKNGFYKKVTLNREGDTVKTIIHNPIEKRLYGTHISTGDTIMTYSSLDEVMADYKSTKVEKETILNLKTFGIRYDFKMKTEFVTYGVEKSSITYYFTKKFKINPENHKNQKDGFYDEIVEQNPFLILKTISNDNFIKEETKTATEIKEYKIDDSIFKVDSTKPIKDI